MVVDKDVVGAFISGICLVHCLLGPILILLGVASLGHAHTDEKAFHFILLVPILMVAAWSLPKGLKKHHQPIPAILAVAGILLLMIGLVFIELSLIFSVFGSLSLLVAHIYNRQLMNKQR